VFNDSILKGPVTTIEEDSSDDSSISTKNAEFAVFIGFHNSSTLLIQTLLLVDYIFSCFWFCLVIPDNETLYFVVAFVICSKCVLDDCANRLSSDTYNA